MKRIKGLVQLSLWVSFLTKGFLLFLLFRGKQNCDWAGAKGVLYLFSMAPITSQIQSSSLAECQPLPCRPYTPPQAASPSFLSLLCTHTVPPPESSLLLLLCLSNPTDPLRTSLFPILSPGQLLSPLTPHSTHTLCCLLGD
jgi:hypothetical protein